MTMIDLMSPRAQTWRREVPQRKGWNVWWRDKQCSLSIAAYTTGNAIKHLWGWLVFQGVLSVLYCVGQSVHSDFSITSYGKTQMNFLASPIFCFPLVSCKDNLVPTKLTKSRKWHWPVLPFQGRQLAGTFAFVCACAVVSDSFVTPRTVACQAPLSMGFPRQEYWRGCSFPSPGDLPNPGMEPASPALAGRFFITEPPGKPWASSILCPKSFHLSSSQFSSKQHLFL